MRYKVTQNTNDNSKKLQSTILKASSFLWKNSENLTANYSAGDIASETDNETLVQSISGGLTWDQWNICFTVSITINTNSHLFGDKSYGIVKFWVMVQTGLQLPGSTLR